MYRERDRIRMAAIKLLLYILLIIISFAVQYLLPPLPVWDVRPLLMMVAVAVITLFTGPYIGGFTGFMCGLICDWLSTYTVTYYTVMLLLMGIILGMISDYTMRKTLLSAYFLAIIILVVTQVLFVVFFLMIFKRAGALTFVYVTTPEILYSLALLPLFYFPSRFIYKKTIFKR